MPLPDRKTSGDGNMNPDAPSAGSTSPARERLFEVAPDVMTIATLDGRFEDVNPAFTASLGWSLEELQGKPVLDLIHSDDHESTAAELAQLREGAASACFDNRHRTRGRGLKRIAWSVRLVDERFFAVGREVPEVSLAVPSAARPEGSPESDLLANRVVYEGDPHT